METTNTETKEPRSAYEIAADDLCAVMAMNDTEYAAIRFEYGLTEKMFPMGWHREFVTAVYSLRENGQPVHDSLIKERCPNAPLSWILQVLTLYDDTRTGAVCRENARLVKHEGLLIGAIRLLDFAKAQMETTKDRETVTARLVDLLQSIGNGGEINGVRMLDHAEKNREKRERKQNNAPLTGMKWWDESDIRYEAGQIWWIAGAYKSRKTSLALNLFLAAALQGISCAMLSKEMAQDRVQSIIEAMLAVGYLKSQGLVGREYEQNGHYLQMDWISGKWLRNNGKGYKYGHPERVKAIEWAFNSYENLPARIYDATPEHGGLVDFNSIQRVINRDIQHYGGKIFFVDYFQLFAPDSTYEEIAKLAKSLQTLAQKKGITLVMLAQRNEDSIKSGGNSYSVGIKGGGDASATADYLFVTRYKENSEDENAENFLDLQIKHAREDAAGGANRRNMPIHPQSGLIFDFDWIERI